MISREDNAINEKETSDMNEILFTAILRSFISEKIPLIF